MSNSQLNNFWTRRIQKEDAALLRHAQEMQRQYSGSRTRSPVSALSGTTVSAAKEASMEEERRPPSSKMQLTRDALERKTFALPKKVDGDDDVESNRSNRSNRSNPSTSKKKKKGVTTESIFGSGAVSSTAAAAAAAAGAGRGKQLVDKKVSSSSARSVSSLSSSSSVGNRNQIGNWVSNVPTQLPPIPSARGSNISESCFSATTITHRAASSTGLISGVTDINRRLEAIESRVEDEKGLRNELRRALMDVRAIVEKARAQQVEQDQQHVSGARSSRSSTKSSRASQR